MSTDLYLQNLVVVGDRVLIKPLSGKNKSRGGLYLPPSVKEKEKVQTGEIIKVGPGYPVPTGDQSFDAHLNGNPQQASYIPLQAKEGQIAMYLQSHAYELEYANETYMIVNQAGILLLINDDLKELGLS